MWTDLSGWDCSEITSDGVKALGSLPNLVSLKLEHVVLKKQALANGIGK